jgi:hypothetical protein
MVDVVQMWSFVWLEAPANARRKMGQLFEIYFRLIGVSDAAS